MGTHTGPQLEGAAHHNRCGDRPSRMGQRQGVLLPVHGVLDVSFDTRQLRERCTGPIRRRHLEVEQGRGARREQSGPSGFLCVYDARGGVRLITDVCPVSSLSHTPTSSPGAVG